VNKGGRKLKNEEACNQGYGAAGVGQYPKESVRNLYDQPRNNYVGSTGLENVPSFGFTPEGHNGHIVLFFMN
jgi:hypothetical protein